MNRIDIMDWTVNCYAFNYRNETINSEFHKFHTHQGLQFLYVHEGIGTIIIDGHIYQARPGMLFLFQPYQLHRIWMNAGNTGSYVRTTFALEPSTYDGHLVSLGSLRDFFQYLWKGALAVQAIDNLSEEDPLIKLFEYLHRQLERTSEEERVAETTVFLINLLHQLRFRSPFAVQLAKGAQPQRDLHHVEAIMQWMELHYQQAFDLERLAADMHLSPSYLSRLFRSCTGSSMTEYLTDLRISKATMLLKYSDYSVDWIAGETGYTNTSYFCQLFKKHTGSPPYQFRLQSRKGTREATTNHAP